MPKKLTVLLAALARAGFVNRGGRGSHRNYLHPSGYRLTVSVHAGEAKPYQQRDIEKAIAAVGGYEHETPNEAYPAPRESDLRPLS